MFTFLKVNIECYACSLEQPFDNEYLGSRLKTPILPIWITCCKDNWGVLFNPNKDLMKSYQAENRLENLMLLLITTHTPPPPKKNKNVIKNIGNSNPL